MDIDHPVSTLDALDHRAVESRVGGERTWLASVSMATLDLDTTAIAATAARVRAAAAELAAARAVVGPEDAIATGDAALAAAVTELYDAWVLTHQALSATLDALALGLDQAAVVFEAAEAATAEQLSGLLLPAPYGASGAGRRGERAL